jgi:hypothetical protein
MTRKPLTCGPFGFRWHIGTEKRPRLSEKGLVAVGGDIGPGKSPSRQGPATPPHAALSSFVPVPAPQSS